jgi:DNA-directed RNA polymerase sigma subunit (sigma70/sigma32)
MRRQRRWSFHHGDAVLHRFLHLLEGTHAYLAHALARATGPGEDHRPAARRTEQDVIDMSRRLGGDVSLNAPIREDGDSREWQDGLVDDVSANQETTLAASEEFENRRKALASALSALNDRERRIFEARRLAEEPITLNQLADEFGVACRPRRALSSCFWPCVG